MVGRSTLAAPISSDGVVLSQPTSSTTPSSGLARIDSSTSMRGEVAVEHRGGPQQRLAERHHRELERKAARFQHARLHVLGDGAEVRVAGRQLGVGVADADDRPAVELVVRDAAVLGPAAVDEAVDVLRGRTTARCASGIVFLAMSVSRPSAGDVEHARRWRTSNPRRPASRPCAAISSTLTKRPIGILDSMNFANSGVTWSRIAVCAAAGVTQLTSTPVCASSLPSALVKAIRPPLAAA